jgi:hypothetical protein
MNGLDLFKALGVAVATMITTLAASYPLVAFYAFFIEPGRPPEFYTQAAQWIAPWSSHVLGPLVFFGFNFQLAKRSPRRNATLFAAATLALYVIVDFGTLPMLGVPITAALNVPVGLSLAGKAAGAFIGAHFGARRRAPRPQHAAP